MKNTIFRFYKLLVNESLLRNSIYLMLSTGVTAVFGFFFWIINARLYSDEQVGLAATLISIMTLISSFSILGLGNGLIRYLPTSERKDKKINTSFTLVALMSILISVIYLIFLKIFSPKLLLVRENIIFSLLFIIFAAFSSLNIISENVFIAYRSSKLVLIRNIISSIAKLILPIFFVTLGAYGIFMSVGIALTIAFSFSLMFLISKFNFLFKPSINKDVVKKMTKFSLGNYIAGFIGGLPVMVIPILITNSLGAEFSAYFYMAMMIANLLYVISSATSQALFAEGSYGETGLKVYLKKAIKIISIIIIPAIIIISLFGNNILLAFGKKYSDEGFTLLKFFSISAIFVSMNTIGSVILNIKHKIGLMILLNLLNTTIILSIIIILMKMNLFRVVDIGVAWNIGHGTTALIYLFLMKKILQ